MSSAAAAAGVSCASRAGTRVTRGVLASGRVLQLVQFIPPERILVAACLFLVLLAIFIVLGVRA